MFLRHVFCLSIVVTVTALLWPMVRSAFVTCEDDPKYRCHPENPSYFIRCTGGKRYEFFCPAGLHFNTRTQTCDWPSQADCTGVSGSNSISTKTKVPFYKNKEASATKFPGWNSYEDGERSDFRKYPKESLEDEDKNKVHPWWKPKGFDWQKRGPKYSPSWKNIPQLKNKTRNPVNPIWRGCKYYFF